MFQSLQNPLKRLQSLEFEDNWAASSSLLKMCWIAQGQSDVLDEKLGQCYIHNLGETHLRGLLSNVCLEESWIWLDMRVKEWGGGERDWNGGWESALIKGPLRLHKVMTDVEGTLKPSDPDSFTETQTVRLKELYRERTTLRILIHLAKHGMAWGKHLIFILGI